MSTSVLESDFPRRRGRVFSGCWTCRYRHLKCDQSRPSCTRCRTAGLECQGYGICLVWTGQAVGSRTSTSKQRSFQRSRLDPTLTLDPAAISREEVHGIQRDLYSTTRKNKPKQTSKGLFSVFTSKPGLPSSAQTTEPETLRNVVHNPNDGGDSQTSPQDTFESRQAQIDLDATGWPYDSVAAVWGGTEGGSESSDDEVQGRSQEQQVTLPFFQQATTLWPSCDVPAVQHATTPSNTNVERALSPTEPHQNTPFGSSASHDHLEASNGGSQKGASHLEVFATLSDQCDLIRHWITTLSPSMNPVVRNQREISLLTTMALEGINSDAEKSNGGIAVFHGICAASAFHLSNLRKDAAHFTKVGMRHRHLALYHLRHSMRNDEHIRDDSIWAAIWTFLFQEGICGSPREWRTHLEGLRSLILATPQAERNSPIARAVYQSYLCIAILGNFQLDDKFDKLLMEMPPTLDYIEPVHGITRTLLEIVFKINTTASKPPSSSIVSDRIQLQLLLYSPAAIPTTGLTESSAKLLVHYSHIYYNATVIHFERLLLKKHPGLLQDLVERTIEHLEAVEAINCHPLGCIWTWPCLVVAVECTDPQLQIRMLAWIETKKRHGFIGLEIAGALVRDIWHRRSLDPDNAGEINWHDMIEGSIYDIIPL